MKDVSPAYIAQEEATKRKPVELYDIWRINGEEEEKNYTTGDVMVFFAGKNYYPATLKRSLIRYDSELDITRCTVQAAFVEDPVLEFIAINPIEIYWIRIMKLHRDQLLIEEEADVIFLGQIKNVTFKGIQADVECVGFEHFLKMPVPKERYQITCNWQVFDLKCKIVKASYKTTAIVTLDPTKTILTAAAFGLEEDGYFRGGSVEFGVEARTIVAHVGNTITMSYRMVNLDLNNDDISDGNVDVYPGCDGRNVTCRDKFDNILNFLGCPYIPIENPAYRT